MLYASRGKEKNKRGHGPRREGKANQLKTNRVHLYLKWKCVNYAYDSQLWARD